MSYTPIATPTGIHDTMIRDSASTCQPQNTSVCACVCVCKNMRVCPQTAHTLLPPTLLVSLKPVTPGRRALSGTKQRSNSMSAFCMQRMAILFSIFVAVKPGVPLRTMNAFTCASRRHSAQRTTSSIHVTSHQRRAQSWCSRVDACISPATPHIHICIYIHHISQMLCAPGHPRCCAPTQPPRRPMCHCQSSACGH